MLEEMTWQMVSDTLTARTLGEARQTRTKLVQSSYKSRTGSAETRTQTSCRVQTI